MIWRRPGYAVTMVDVLGSFLIFLIFAAFFAVIFFYVGYIGLIIFLSIGAAVGLAYSIYIYIKSFVSAAKGLGTVTARNVFATILLKWFTLYKETSRNAFLDNFVIARNAVTKSHSYRILSFRKWMWLMVAPATLIFGTALIFAIIIIQGGLLLAFFGTAFLLILLFCVLMLLVCLLYGIVATIRNLKVAFSGKPNIFCSFDFSMTAKLSEFPLAMKGYLTTIVSYINGIWAENFALGKSNIGMAGGYRLFSIQRYFLYLSIIGLMTVAIIFSCVIFLLLVILFPIMVITNFIFILIAMLMRFILSK